MAQNTISTAILIIAGVIATAALLNALFPAIYGMSGSVSSVSESSSDRMKTDFRIISEGLDPLNSNMLHVYVKNTGRLKISSSNIEKSDVYFGSGSAMYKARFDAAAPSWQYTIQDGNSDSVWNPGETLDIAITANSYDFMTDRQTVRFAAYNGVSIEGIFTL